MLRRSSIYLTLTSLRNQAGRAEELRKFGASRKNPDGLEKGIPPKPRLDMHSISVIHESKRIIVAGRNKCNNFGCNQFMIANKTTQEAILVDMADDWPDDWVSFIREGGFKVQCVFMTHLHIDNMVGLSAFLKMMPVKVAWNIAEQYWADRFHLACQRYGRSELNGVVLPMANMTDSSRNMVLSCATTRSASILPIGDVTCQYIHTPGHSAGHMVLSVPSEKLLFSGDLLFYNRIGRVDLPNAVGSELAKSLRILEDLPDNTVVLPGHGRMTTLARERRSNLALRRVYEMIAMGKQEPSVGLNECGWL